VICRWDAAGVFGCTALALVRLTALAALGTVSGCSSGLEVELDGPCAKRTLRRSLKVIQEKVEMGSDVPDGPGHWGVS
jgi:hypothetical protein